jgi:hypothetical protein
MTKQNIVVSYGGGVNSVALCVWLAQNGHAPNVRAIVMADPGSERSATYAYRDHVMQPYLARMGMPPITVVNRIEEGRHRPRAWRLETLEQECLRIRSLPSVAYGWKKCSAKYKAEPQRWWLERQPWVQELWARGEKLTRTLGYDAGERRRVDNARDVQKPKTETQHFDYWYPVHDAGLYREDCERLITDAGLPPAQKSACTFCPNNTFAEWEDLRVNEPYAFERAVEMSYNAVLEEPW